MIAPHQTGSPEAPSPFFAFALRGQVFAVPSLSVRRVIELARITPVLHPPDYGTGFAIAPAGTLSLVDLRVLAGGRSRFTPATCVVELVVPRPDGTPIEVGLIVDRVPVPPAFASDEVLRAAGPVAGTTPCVAGWLNADGRAVPLLDVDALFQRAADPRRLAPARSASRRRRPGRNRLPSAA